MLNWQLESLLVSERDEGWREEKKRRWRSERRVCCFVLMNIHSFLSSSEEKTHGELSQLC